MIRGGISVSDEDLIDAPKLVMAMTLPPSARGNFTALLQQQTDENLNRDPNPCLQSEHDRRRCCLLYQYTQQYELRRGKGTSPKPILSAGQQFAETEVGSNVVRWSI
jgi:hypothetical protein